MTTRAIFRTMIKGATVALTAPVTWLVLGDLGVGLPPAIRYYTTPLAGVVLVEAALLYAWWLLDHEKNASTEQRTLYAIIMTLSYGAITVIALRHGEGLAGLAVRLVMVGVMAMSFVESGILAWLKRERQADNDISRDWQVRRHAKRQARAEAIADRTALSQIAGAERQARTTVRLAEITREREAALNAIAPASTPVTLSSNGNGKHVEAAPASFR